MSADWAAVASAINTRMDELGITQVALAARSKVSVATIRALQRNYEAKDRQARTLEALSVALDWPPRHLTAVCNGDDVPRGRSDVDELRSEVAELRSRVATLEAQVQEN